MSENKTAITITKSPLEAEDWHTRRAVDWRILLNLRHKSSGPPPTLGAFGKI